MKSISITGFCKLVGKTEEEIKGGSLYLSGTGITQLPENLTVGGSLDLSGTGITQLPENLTVGGFLDLRGTGITQLPENLTVGGYLYLRGTGITQLPENLTVGGSLGLRGTGITETNKINRTLSAEAKRKIAAKLNMVIVWEWSNRTYIKIDGIISVVDSHHGNVWRVHQLGCKEQTFIVTNGEHHYAHGDTIEEARKDLVYKICDRDKSEYEHLTLDSKLTYSEAIECYRVITGACSAGTR